MTTQSMSYIMTKILNNKYIFLLGAERIVPREWPLLRNVPLTVTGLKVLGKSNSRPEQFVYSHLISQRLSFSLKTKLKYS